MYQPGSTIVCHRLLAADGFCLFLQGNVPRAGVSGSLVKERLNDLIVHGCSDCGSVPLSGNNNPDEMGVLTSNYVTVAERDGLW